MREYLHGCHYHWSLDEEPIEFGEPNFLCERQDEMRTMWLWESIDPLGRKWWIVVASGGSRRAASMWRWMYAETNEAYETPDAFLNHAWRDAAENL
jgi:hypothetical protein